MTPHPSLPIHAVCVNCGSSSGARPDYVQAAQTLGAALAGILAGTTMAYAFDLVENAIAGRPQQFAFDTTVTPFVIVMVVLMMVMATNVLRC